MTGKEMIIYLCTFLFVLPQKEKIPKEKSQALNLRGYSERVFAKYIVRLDAAWLPALTGGREAEGSFQPLKRADCLSEASFCPLG